MGTWRDDVDPILREHLEIIISESVKQRNAYKKAKNTANGQIWCALAYLAKELFELEQENKVLQRNIKDLQDKYRLLEEVLKKSGKLKQKDDIDPAKALKDVLKRL
ncbi:hypothetical protein D6777_00685 [Candidatus Woesearchaeota archaeon]|nr:MAG: hypothetical protein D6777_00685 [Candidatus Woesearchaeota archaeon]